MKKIILILTIIFILLSIQIVYGSKYTCFPRHYEVFLTKNFYSILLLNTRTGKLWQFSEDNKNNWHKFSINNPIVNSSKNGRFTLIPTKNFWNYLLTDTETGAIWRCQFSLNSPKYRGCILINP